MVELVEILKVFKNLFLNCKFSLKSTRFVEELSLVYAAIKLKDIYAKSLMQQLNLLYDRSSIFFKKRKEKE